MRLDMGNALRSYTRNERVKTLPMGHHKAQVIAIAAQKGDESGSPFRIVSAAASTAELIFSTIVSLSSCVIWVLLGHVEQPGDLRLDALWNLLRPVVPVGTIMVPNHAL